MCIFFCIKSFCTFYLKKKIEIFFIDAFRICLDSNLKSRNLSINRDVAKFKSNTLFNKSNQQRA